MKTISREFSVKDLDIQKKTFCVSQVSTDEFSYEEGARELAKFQQRIAKIKVEKQRLEEYVTEKKYEADLDNMQRDIDNDLKIVDTFIEALKPFFDKKEEEGQKLVEAMKKDKGYNILKHKLIKEAKERQRGKEWTPEDKQRVLRDDGLKQLRVEILNTVREQLGFTDIAHPVIMNLGRTFDGE